VRITYRSNLADCRSAGDVDGNGSEDRSSSTDRNVDVLLQWKPHRNRNAELQWRSNLDNQHATGWHRHNHCQL
jgi:hypothetical protein